MIVVVGGLGTSDYLNTDLDKSSNLTLIIAKLL
jgi:hypothetical protein